MHEACLVPSASLLILNTIFNNINRYCFSYDLILFLQSHYSVMKSSIILGVGMDNVIKVKCDKRYNNYINFVHLQSEFEQYN